uniref:Carboxyl-terminal processing protease n=1 Tax=Candidatus Kentrum sp. FW TaxID=2126338 RepID=A0A450SF74_9GAMM|nr:MAG: carboxyl-terminal processing protease [Candidatus Kentron sp. FW]
MRILLQAILVLLCLSVSPIEAALQEEQASLAPLPRHAKITKLVVGLVTNYHYRKTVLNDTLSAEILEQYLLNLDLNRSFFSEKDVKRLQSLYEDRLDNALQNANIAPAFEIFSIYKERVVERIRKAMHLVDQDFDFTVDENYIPDRAEQPWAASALELDEIWRKRVKNDLLVLRLEGEKDDTEIHKTLRKRYETSLRYVRQFTSDDICQIFINAYAAAVGPHTTYLSSRNSENLFIHLTQSLEGIGAVLQSENEHTVVRKIIHGGPADKDGTLQVDDVITGVGQDTQGEIVDVVGWRLQDVVNLIRGPKGSVVRLRLLEGKTGRDGPAKQISLVRNRVDLADRAAKKSVIDIPTESGDFHIGVITLPTFYAEVRPRARKQNKKRGTTHDVRKLIDNLRKEPVDGIVLDLRGNSGGSLEEAINLTGLFLESGPIVQIKKSDGQFIIRESTDPGMVWSGPLVVLVDRNSASASEILAAAIQDYGRGLIVGETTHGKGTVQHLINLDEVAKSDTKNLGQLKLTIAQFFRINGASTQYRGVVPDIILPRVGSSEDQGERGLENALPWASVPDIEFSRHMPLGDIILSTVRTKYEERMMRESVFDILREELAAQQKIRDKTRFTLLETRRRAERKARKDAHKIREERLRMAIGQEKPKVTKQKNMEEEKPIASEIILREAANITIDMISAYHH